MDIAEFRAIRSPGTQAKDSLLLAEEITLPPINNNEAITNKRLASSPITFNSLPAEWGAAENPLKPLIYNQLDTPIQRLYYILQTINGQLKLANDWLDGSELVNQIESLIKALNIKEREWQEGRLILQLSITHWLIEALKSKEFEHATDLTRLTLVCDLIGQDFAELVKLNKTDISARLTLRSVVLPPAVSEQLAAQARIQLIREATVADLHVIRREWACYIAGEIANIRNLMAGESFTQSITQLRERETTSTSDIERQEQTEQEDMSKLATELNQEINTQLNLSINGYVDASAQYKTPIATINVSGGGNAGLSVQRGERFASKIARESVSRAVQRVDTRTRETRSERELSRNEDVTHYELKNGNQNTHAIYRWVDRVDRYQVFRYPDRLQLEFQLPEPAEFYRKRTEAAVASSVDKPPESFTLKVDDITPGTLIEKAQIYRASNLPAPPDEEILVTDTITLDTAKESLPSTGNEQFNVSSISKEVKISIPTNYRATAMTYSGHGYPILGVWKVPHKEGTSNEWGYHSCFATVSVGDTSQVSWVGGFQENTGIFMASYGDVVDKGSAENIQLDGGKDEYQGVPYGRAMLIIGKMGSALQPLAADSINFDPGVELTLKVALSTVGLAGCVVTFKVTCKRTTEAYLAWQLRVYDALFSAWSQWKQDYETAQLRRTMVGGGISDTGSSQRNEQIIREELKRQVIGWLLDEKDFSGRPGLEDPLPSTSKPHAAGFNTPDFTKIRADAPTIQFMEQAFEWGNMMYVFYPYYWAGASNWRSLSSLTANDIEFEHFLRAGSARVVVPARQAFTDAVKNWLLFKEPFITGQLPTLNNELYISIDHEIRDITSPWEGGIAEDWWESRVSTTMLYLDDEAALPISNENAVLPAIKNESYVPKPICEASKNNIHSGSETFLDRFVKCLKTIFSASKQG